MINSKKKLDMTLAVVFAAVYFIHLFIASSVLNKAITDSAGSPSTVMNYSYLALFWISLSGLFAYRATNYNQSPRHQAIAFIVSPILLLPLLVILHVFVVLLPIYDLVGPNT